MLAGEGRHKEAIALLRRRLADAPGDPDCWQRWALLRRGR